MSEAYCMKEKTKREISSTGSDAQERTEDNARDLCISAEQKSSRYWEISATSKAQASASWQRLKLSACSASSSIILILEYVSSDPSPFLELSVDGLWSHGLRRHVMLFPRASLVESTVRQAAEIRGLIKSSTARLHRQAHRSPQQSLRAPQMPALQCPDHIPSLQEPVNIIIRDECQRCEHRDFFSSKMDGIVVLP